jgi:hypothetical protein
VCCAIGGDSLNIISVFRPGLECFAGIASRADGGDAGALGYSRCKSLKSMARALEGVADELGAAGATRPQDVHPSEYCVLSVDRICLGTGFSAVCWNRFFCFAFSSSRLRAGHGSWISTSSDVLPSTSLGPIASLTDAGRNAIATTTSKSNP